MYDYFLETWIGMIVDNSEPRFFRFFFKFVLDH